MVDVITIQAVHEWVPDEQSDAAAMNRGNKRFCPAEVAVTTSKKKKKLKKTNKAIDESRGNLCHGRPC